MKKLIILAALCFAGCASTGRPIPAFATYGDETGLIGNRELTYEYAYGVWQVGDIKDLQAFVSCEIRFLENKLQGIAADEARHMEKHRRQRYYIGNDYYMSAMARKRAGALERLRMTQWLAYYAKLQTDQPCTQSDKLLAARFYENHMAGKYSPR